MHSWYVRRYTREEAESEKEAHWFARSRKEDGCVGEGRTSLGSP